MSEASPIGKLGAVKVTAGNSARHRGWAVWGRRLLLLSALALYLLHFFHLGADFPHGSPWNDWSKYTDEGWYGDGAIRHFVLGHWYLPGDFNPAVAMPVWPLLETAVFAVTGVSLEAARALAVVVFGVTLLALYGLIERRAMTGAPGSGIAAPLTVFLACANPFLFAFGRLAILEPLVAALGVSALWVTSFVASRSGRESERVLGESFAFTRSTVSLAMGAGSGVLLALLGLSKPTALALFPAILYLLWREAGGDWRRAGRLAAVPVAVAAVIGLGYFAVLRRFQLLGDFHYLFDANAYTGFGLQPLGEVVRNTLLGGQFMGGWIYGLFAFAMLTMALFRRRFFRQPLAGALLLWAAGYLLLLGYHNNLQPRYYLLLAVPAIALLAMAVEESIAWAAEVHSSALQAGWTSICAVGLGAVAFGGIRQEADYVRHPNYSYLSAAREIAAIVRATPKQSPWVLSVSGSDLTLMTGLPSIDDDFGTLDLDERVSQYRPGWYVAWNEIDDDKMEGLRALYRPVRVAAFPAMDDPDRNLLILYRLDPVGQDGAWQKGRQRMPTVFHVCSRQRLGSAQARH